MTRTFLINFLAGWLIVGAYWEWLGYMVYAVPPATGFVGRQLISSGVSFVCVLWGGYIGEPLPEGESRMVWAPMRAAMVLALVAFGASSFGQTVYGLIGEELGGGAPWSATVEHVKRQGTVRLAGVLIDSDDRFLTMAVCSGGIAEIVAIPVDDVGSIRLHKRVSGATIEDAGEVCDSTP